MSFPLIGNERLRESVETLIATDRIPHAILIEGDAGTGKRTLAKYLSKAVLCDGETRPCDTCRNCHLVEVGSHPDSVTVAPEDGKKNITVDGIRNLRQQAFIKPHMAQRRVFIIERAHTLNEQAQNALLKVLEEPPADAVFLLITESKNALLPTVLSRCVCLSVGVPETAPAAEYLINLLSKDRDTVLAALQNTGNNIGSAISLLREQTDEAAKSTADKFLRLLQTGNEYEMLKLLSPLEKDRVGTDAFFAALKTAIAKEMRKNLVSTAKTRFFDRLYRQTDESIRLLKTNINLPLLFSATVCRANQLKNEN